MNEETTSDSDMEQRGDGAAVTLTSILDSLRARFYLLSFGTIVAGIAAFAGTYLIEPKFTAITTFMPPQQAQGGSAAALASLGALASLAGGNVGVRNSADQYVSLMQSVTVSDRLIERFNLREVYGEKLRADARRELSKNLRIAVGKKDGMINLEFDDASPQRAADIANRYVDELRIISSSLAVTEAQQRRVFFEQQLQQSKERLELAQRGLQASGFNASALKAEPKAAAESFARLKAEATATEVRLQTLRGSLADDTPEVRQQQAALTALRGQLALAEQATSTRSDSDYISKYREFKYQEALFELYARQFELARMDEVREGALIQVVDPATPPEKKSKPKRGTVAISTALAAALALAFWIVIRNAIRKPKPA